MVLTIFASVTGVNMEDTLRPLDWVPCIYYPLRFWKDIIDVWALIDLSNEVNAITLAYSAKLGFKVWPIDVRAPKIDSSLLRNFEIVIASIQVFNMLDQARFFQETFLLTDISAEVMLGMLFLARSNANIKFAAQKLTWRSYTVAKILPTTKLIKRNLLKRRWMNSQRTL